jgi:hypothetical protein
MPTRDTIENITAILTWAGLENLPGDTRDLASGQAEDERTELAENLRKARDHGGEDPVLACLAHARDQMLMAERDRRLLLAYAREFTEPRPYRLDDLARAAGMSISGVRTAYDQDEITAITAITGLPPRSLR